MITQLFSAVRSGETDNIQAILAVSPKLLHAREPGGMSLVMAALQANQLELAETIAYWKLAQLRKGRVKHRDLYGLIHDLGEARLLEAESDVANFLDDGDSDLRYIAVNVLAFHWELITYKQRIEKLLQSDPAEHVRSVAAAGLGFLLRGTKDAAATRTLLEMLKDEKEKGSIRKAAYRALLDLWLPEGKRNDSLIKAIQQATEELDADLERAQGVADATTQPEPFRTLELSFLPDRPPEDWARDVDWDLVRAIERGEMP